MDAETLTAYEELKRIASRGEVITCSMVEQLVGLPPQDPHLFHILEHISRQEVAEGRPMLSAVVVLSGERVPDDSFFRLARELSRIQFGERDWDFWRRERDSVHKHWFNKHRAVVSPTASAFLQLRPRESSMFPMAPVC